MTPPQTFESSDDDGLATLGIEIGDRIGRYVVLSQIGVGAMGMILAAYDPELDRKAALKLLKRRAETRPKARTRLRREAQALAKLHHPNVVSVYDVGVHEQQVFIAMEFVQGRALSEWMAVRDGRVRPWREVLSAFAAAGRGLMAVHEVGLVHRDFKPDNVMIDDDGRVLVADFGLARLIGGSEPDESEDTSELEFPDTKVLRSKLTKTGASLGTPAYMAPEQFRGEPATPYSDQFSFCVALSEGLHGSFPPASSARDLPAEKPSNVHVPAWLEHVLERGLSPDPQQRFASMAELIDALGAGEARRRRLGALAAVAVVAFAVAGGVGLQQRQAAAREAACVEAGNAVDRIWNANSRAALVDGVLATEVGYAPTVVEKLMPWLDRQAQTWREHATLACRNATIGRGGAGDARWTAATYDKATWCLEQHRLELELLVSELSAADAGMVESAVLAAAGMSLVETCTDEASLATLPDPPAEQLRSQVVDIRRELMRATILERAGDYEGGLAIARDGLSHAEVLGWIPLTAALRAREASLLRETGAYKEAELVGEAAYMEAALAGAWDVAAMAATKQSIIVGLHGDRPDVGKAWATIDALIAITHAGDPFGLREASRLNNLAAIHWGAGENEDAARLYQQALEMRERALGPDHPEVASALQNLGAARRALGKYEEAQALYQRALAIYEQTLGPKHPKLASLLSNLGNAQAVMGHKKEARVSFERALAIQREALGLDHPKTAMMLLNMANTYSIEREAVEMEAVIRQALGIYERLGMTDDRATATARTTLGRLLTITKRFEEAELLLLEARASLERSNGPEHPDVATSILALGNLYLAKGELEQARSMHERTLELHVKVFGPDHQEVADSRYYLALVHEKAGQLELACEQLERALAIQLGSDGKAGDLAETRFALGRVLPEAQRARAREQVEQALAFYLTDADSAKETRDAQQWLAAHPPI
jgi:tetratricopeptide (TPR) repeat protein/tRNA A-37 threonylcarbamoyl transferase component Bud32